MLNLNRLEPSRKSYKLKFDWSMRCATTLNTNKLRNGFCWGWAAARRKPIRQCCLFYSSKTPHVQDIKKGDWKSTEIQWNSHGRGQTVLSLSTASKHADVSSKDRAQLRYSSLSVKLIPDPTKENAGSDNCSTRVL